MCDVKNHAHGSNFDFYYTFKSSRCLRLLHDRVILFIIIFNNFLRFFSSLLGHDCLAAERTLVLNGRILGRHFVDAFTMEHVCVTTFELHDKVVLFVLLEANRTFFIVNPW